MGAAVPWANEVRAVEPAPTIVASARAVHTDAVPVTIVGAERVLARDPVVARGAVARTLMAKPTVLAARPTRFLSAVHIRPAGVANAHMPQVLGACAVARAIVCALLGIARWAAPARWAEAATFAGQAQPAEAAVTGACLQLAAQPLGKGRAVTGGVCAVTNAGTFTTFRRGAGQAGAIDAAVPLEAVADALLARPLPMAVASWPLTLLTSPALVALAAAVGE